MTSAKCAAYKHVVMLFLYRMIYDHYVNMYNWTFNGRSQEFVSTVKNWFANQRAWVNSAISKIHVNNHILWKYMELLNVQYQGKYHIMGNFLGTCKFVEHKIFILK